MSSDDTRFSVPRFLWAGWAAPYLYCLQESVWTEQEGALRARAQLAASRAQATGELAACRAQTAAKLADARAAAAQAERRGEDVAEALRSALAKTQGRTQRLLEEGQHAQQRVREAKEVEAEQQRALIVVRSALRTAQQRLQAALGSAHLQQTEVRLCCRQHCDGQRRLHALLRDEPGHLHGSVCSRYPRRRGTPDCPAPLAARCPARPKSRCVRREKSSAPTVRRSPRCTSGCARCGRSACGSRWSASRNCSVLAA